MGYSFRIPLLIAFVAAAARLLLDLPPRVPYALAASFALVIAGERFRAWWRLRRWTAANIAAGHTPEVEFVQCGAQHALGLGTLFVRCDKSDGHIEHEHESGTGFRWMDAQ